MTSTTERLAHLAIEYYQNMTEKLPLGKSRKGEIVQPFPKNQYPRYFSIWQGRHPSMEDIEIESPNLAQAVKLNPQLVRQGIFDSLPSGEIIFDSLIFQKSDYERGK